LAWGHIFLQNILSADGVSNNNIQFKKGHLS